MGGEDIKPMLRECNQILKVGGKKDHLRMKALTKELTWGGHTLNGLKVLLEVHFSGCLSKTNPGPVF